MPEKTKDEGGSFPMEYVSLIAAISVAVIVHELAHAIMMRKYGVEIKQFGIGIPLIPITLITFHIGRVPVLVHPLLIGAYVEPTHHGEECLQDLSLGRRMDIYAAGVLANILLCALTAGVVYWGYEIKYIPIPVHIAAIAIGVVLLLLRRAFAFLVPILGLAVVWLLIQTFIGTPDAVMGPVGMASQPSALDTTLWERIINISFSLALFNMIPVPPLDGGHAAVALLEGVFGKHTTVQNSVMTIGTALLIAFIIWITFGDVSRLMGG